MLKKSKIYVAGHTGMLGSALVRKLKSLGYTNIITRTRAELDLTDYNSVENFFQQERPEYVFLCAGLSGGIRANISYPADFLFTNLAIQTNIFQCANKYDVKHVIFYGCSCVYPKDAKQPIKEEYLLEGRIEKTNEAFAIAKISGILACKYYNQQFNTNKFISLVPSNIYGINDNFDLSTSHVIPAIIRKVYEAKKNKKDKVTLWGSGHPRRDFIFSEDVVEASIFVVNNVDKLQNTHYNISTGLSYSIKEISEIICKVVGYQGRIEWDTSQPDGVLERCLDNSKILSLGWRPQISIEKGIEITYSWYIDNLDKFL